MPREQTICDPFVAATLRRYRENARCTVARAATLLGCDRSRISRIEAATRGIRAHEMRALLTAYGASQPVPDMLVGFARAYGHGGWWDHFPGLYTDAFTDILVAETIASGICLYAPLRIPDLLQASGYARALADADPAIPGGLKATAAKAALARQRAVTHDGHCRLAVIIGEGALKQAIGPPPVLRAQLRHLARLTRTRPQVSIRVLPLVATAPVGGTGTFSVLQFGESHAPCLVHVDGPAGGLLLDGPLAPAAYIAAFRHLQTSALSPQESATMLLRGTPRAERWRT